MIGLTATAPDDMTADEAALYERAARPGRLPHADAGRRARGLPRARSRSSRCSRRRWTPSCEWLRERHERFQELLDRADGASATTSSSFPVWVSNRLRHRGDRRGRGPVRASCCAASRRWRAPACATSASAGLPLPPGAPRGEGFREPPSMDDWLALLADYALRCLRAHPRADARRALDALAVGLADLGFTLTRTGIRPGRTDIDRVLVNSAAKPILACEALAARARGPRRRAARRRAVRLRAPAQAAGGVAARARRRRPRAARDDRRRPAARAAAAAARHGRDFVWPRRATSRDAGDVAGVGGAGGPRCCARAGRSA